MWHIFSYIGAKWKTFPPKKGQGNVRFPDFCFTVGYLISLDVNKRKELWASRGDVIRLSSDSVPNQSFS